MATAGDTGLSSGRGSTPSPDPTVLTTDALTREVQNMKELIKDSIAAEHDVTTEKFRAIDHEFEVVERHRKEQKDDTQREITKAFDANTEAIGAVEKIQSIDSGRISAVEANRQGGIDMRVAIFATVALLAGCGTLLLTAAGIAVTIVIATR